MPDTSAGSPVGEQQTSLVAVQDQPDFVELRRRLRSFVFPMTAAFLAWYLLYVLCSAFARGFMAHRLVGNINVGFVFGLLQFVSTFAIAYWYSQYADRRLDPLADKLRAHINSGGAR